MTRRVAHRARCVGREQARSTGVAGARVRNLVRRCCHVLAPCRRERNKASARASRKKRKALLEGLAGKVTSLAEHTDRERLARAETAASGVDRRRAELVASARAALAAAASSSIPDGGASDYAARGSSAGAVDHSKQRRRQTASAAAAALPALLRERFSLAGSERRALIDFALEHSAATAMPHHLRVLAYMAEQGPEFFSTSDQRVAGAEAARARADAAFEASPALAGIASGSVSALPAAPDTERPDLWGILANELWLSDAGSESLRALLQSTGAASMAAMREAVVANRRLRAAIAQRAEAAAALGASVHSVLTPAQELAFQDFLSRNAERIRTLMPAASRTRSTDAAAAETSRAAHGPSVAGMDGIAQARRAEEQLQAAVMIAREASGASLPEVASTPRAGAQAPPCTGPSY